MIIHINNRVLLILLFIHCDLKSMMQIKSEKILQ